tara:strand:- start:290 stop:469 length:180 start_codon:yes stop_codon:yes gene_type:complete
MSQIIIDLAKKAGIAYLPQIEEIGGRGFFANMEELTLFAKLVGEISRKHERNKLKGSTG